MASQLQPLPLRTDLLLEVDTLINDATGAAIADATITVTLVDYGTGDEIGGQAWPTAFTLYSGSTYHAVIDKAVEVVAGNVYSAIITAAAPGGLDRSWNQLLIAQEPYV